MEKGGILQKCLALDTLEAKNIEAPIDRSQKCDLLDLALLIKKKVLQKDVRVVDYFRCSTPAIESALIMNRVFCDPTLLKFSIANKQSYRFVNLME